MLTLTREQARKIDQIAIEQFGIPGIVLMENAARGCAEQIFVMLREHYGADEGYRAAILCGGGNNGGDGYAIARHLHNFGVAVSVYSIVEPASLKGDAATNRWICAKIAEACAGGEGPRLEIKDVPEGVALAGSAIEWEKADVIVDALLGTGFSGALRPHVAEAIRLCNQASERANKPVVAVDVPSGLDCDTGKAELAVRATMTVTFIAQKKAFLEEGAEDWTGSVMVVDIGAPPEALRKAVGE
ncbi:MAG TPA: NAD(P)H-hydrate epimerase [Planctomycetota bacterium]|nr:NAD(P)H-hydrate epimerase [Planctomycetota bacterium]